jgi:hypothetical protein
LAWSDRIYRCTRKLIKEKRRSLDPLLASRVMLMWNLVNFWFPWQFLRFLRFSIVIPS